MIGLYEKLLFFSRIQRFNLIEIKAHMTTTLQSRMMSISQFQSHIASIPSTLTALNSALEKQSEAFLQILHIHRMAPAWGAALVEVVRRKEYTKVFLAKAKEMAEILSKFRALEDRRRDNFKTEILRYLPLNVISGLDDRPPYCEISVSNTKDTLPDINKQDIVGKWQLILDFEKMVGHIKSSMNASASDSISKLQTTLVKISSQVDAVPAEFEKIIEKSNLVGRWSQILEDNVRLKRQTSQTATTPLSGTPPSRHDDAIRIYEARIKSLELLIQEKFAGQKNPKEDLGHYKQLLDEEARKTLDLQKKIESLKLSNDQLQGSLEAKSKKCDTLSNELSEMDQLYKASIQENQALNQTLQVELEKNYLADLQNASGERHSKKKETQSSDQLISKLSTRPSSDGAFQKTLPQLSQLDPLIDTPQQATELQSVTQSSITKSEKIQLMMARERLDDMCIVTRMYVEQLNHYFSAMIQLSLTICPGLVPEFTDLKVFNFDDVLSLDIDDHGSEMNVFLNQMNTFVKAAYSKIIKTSTLLIPRDCVLDIKTKYESLAIDSHAKIQILGQRVAFERFAVSDLVLFLPVKNCHVWSAFNINTPNYYLISDSHPAFEQRIS